MHPPTESSVGWLGARPTCYDDVASGRPRRRGRRAERSLPREGRAARGLTSRCAGDLVPGPRGEWRCSSDVGCLLTPVPGLALLRLVISTERAGRPVDTGKGPTPGRMCSIWPSARGSNSSTITIASRILSACRSAQPSCPYCLDASLLDLLGLGQRPPVWSAACHMEWRRSLPVWSAD